MKKSISLLLVIGFCLGLCACGAGGGAGLGTGVWEKAYYLDAFNDPTEAYYIGTAKRLSGSYSSGSVTDGKLEAAIRADAEKISIYLYEEGSELVKNSGSADIAFSVLMKSADGNKTQLSGKMTSGGDCVVIPENQAGSILHFADAQQTDNSVAKALCAENGEVSFYLTREDQPATSYLFTVRTGNFAALYEAEIVTPIREEAYARAEELLAAKDYTGAIAAFTALGDYRDSAARVEEAKEKQEALRAVRIEMGKKPLAAGGNCTVGLKADGTVVAVGKNNDGQCEVSDWTDIVAVATGGNCTVGLKADGTVVAVGWNDDGQCEVTDWTDIVAVAAGLVHTIGLKADGTVVAVWYNGEGGCEVSEWTDIVAVAAGGYHTVGLKADGTVVAVGENGSGQCEVSGWTDIVAVAAGTGHTVGLKADGTVVAVGYNGDGRCEVSEWTDIVAVAAGGLHTVGLKADGTVVAVGWNDDGQCEVTDWTDIVAVATGWYHTVGLKADGTVVAVGRNNDGQCEVSDWTDIRLP